ncbi:MAG TPA: hypothetical protein VKT77_12655 [Chthonomonadaceae bacterium]|nr:hypothetical protein [Chthonomonadaceae bacterium]
MTSSRQAMDEAGRKRHLEALFADEPYLSPTMKARRMHEKMLDDMPGIFSAERQPASTLAADPQRTAALLEEPLPLRTDRAGGQAPQMTFEEARRHLSGQGVPDPYAFTPSDPLSYFRTQVLSQWIQKVDRRENE